MSPLSYRAFSQGKGWNLGEFKAQFLPRSWCQAHAKTSTDNLSSGWIHHTWALLPNPTPPPQASTASFLRQSFYTRQRSTWPTPTVHQQHRTNHHTRPPTLHEADYRQTASASGTAASSDEASTSSLEEAAARTAAAAASSASTPESHADEGSRSSFRSSRSFQLACPSTPSLLDYFPFLLTGLHPWPRKPSLLPARGTCASTPSEAPHSLRNQACSWPTASHHRWLSSFSPADICRTLHLQSALWGHPKFEPLQKELTNRRFFYYEPKHTQAIE